MNLPNKLTVLRIIMIPVFVIITCGNFILGDVQILGTNIAVSQLIGAMLFTIASITDWLDGKIARSQGLVTNFGKFADPLADKMLVLTAFIVLVGQGKVAAWIAAIIVCRELAVTGLRLILVETNGEVLAAAWPGKIKTATQMLAIILLFLNNIGFAALNLPVANILLYICTVFTIYSGIDYFYQNKSVFKDSM